MNTKQLIVDCIALLMVMSFELASAAWDREGDGTQDSAECPLVKNPVWPVNDDTGCPREDGLVFFPSHGHGDKCDGCSENAYDILQVDTDSK